MRLSPAPPTELTDLIDAYEQTARAVVDLGRACPPERVGDPTPCPGWDVFAQVAHVESVEAMFSGEPAPQIEIEPDRPHVRNDFGRMIERLIESRRGLSLPEVCDRLEATIERRVAYFRSDQVTPETEVPGPFGMMPALALLGVRCFDIWSHEQDLRETLGMPGNLDSPAAVEAMRRMYASLGRIAVAAGVPVGQAVAVELTGPVTGWGAARVVEQDGKLRGAPAEVTDDEALAVLRLDTRSAGRLIAGRNPVGRDSGFPWTSSGDPQTVRMLVRKFGVTP